MFRCPANAIALSLGSLFASTAPAAQLSSLDLTAPGYLISVCGGLSDGSSPNPGSSLSLDAGEFECNSAQDDSTSPLDAVAASQSWDEAAVSVTTASEGTARFGVVTLFATYTGPNSAHFPLASATGGWMDTFLVEAGNPGDTGANGVLSFEIEVDGTLSAVAGFNTAAQLVVRAYKDDGLIALPSSYGVQGQGQIGSPYAEVVDHVVVAFQVPFVFGTPFELGVFAQAFARTASQAGVSAINVSTVDFSDTIRWHGITSVARDGVGPVAYTLTSGSGIDWTEPTPVPEPGTAASAAIALGWLVRRAARRRRARCAPLPAFVKFRWRPSSAAFG